MKPLRKYKYHQPLCVWYATVVFGKFEIRKRPWVSRGGHLWYGYTYRMVWADDSSPKDPSWNAATCCEKLNPDLYGCLTQRSKGGSRSLARVIRLEITATLLVLSTQSYAITEQLLSNHITHDSTRLQISLNNNLQNKPNKYGVRNRL